jgi:hypothetical protein
LPSGAAAGSGQDASTEVIWVRSAFGSSHMEGYSPDHRCMPLPSISTKLCPGSPACMPFPRVPYFWDTVPSSSKKGVVTLFAR